MHDQPQESRLDELRQAHSQAAMVGWDFSRLDGAMTAQDPPWDFEQDCLEAMRSAEAVLDVGTGGGERLLALLDRLGEDPAKTKRVEATEGWEPNVPVAREALAPRQVPVHFCDPENHDRIAADDGTFDLIMNRHEALDAAETARLLAPGGRFITQQVHGLDVPEFEKWFGSVPQYPRVNPEQFSVALIDAGLTVTTVDDWSGTMEFADAEALVTYLGLVPWDVPEDFSVDRFADVLLRLDQAPITVTQRRFRVYAQKSGS